MSKYDELKQRIENLDNGWDKNADDILNEMGKNSDYWICIGTAKDETSTDYVQIIDVHNNNFKLITEFQYRSQCLKFSAFKKALLWLLDHSELAEEKNEEIKNGDYVVALDSCYFDGSWSIKGLKVGDIFKPEMIDDGYCYIEYRGANCDLKSVRKATKKEVEEYLREKKDEKKDKISKLEEKMKEIQQEIEDLKNRV